MSTQNRDGTATDDQRCSGREATRRSTHAGWAFGAEIFDALPTPMALAAPSGIVAEVNAAWCRLTGHTLVAADHPVYVIRRKND